MKQKIHQEAEITTTSLPREETEDDNEDDTEESSTGIDLNAALEKMARLGQETNLNAVLSSGVDATTSLLASDLKQRQALFELL